MEYQPKRLLIKEIIDCYRCPMRSQLSIEKHACRELPPEKRKLWDEWLNEKGEVILATKGIIYDGCPLPKITADPGEDYPEPKFPSGVNLWNKKQKSIVRIAYDFDYNDEKIWDEESGEWSYLDKYGSGWMLESELEWPKEDEDDES